MRLHFWSPQVASDEISIASLFYRVANKVNDATKQINTPNISTAASIGWCRSNVLVGIWFAKLAVLRKDSR